ncbi:hypothetical protein ALC62_13273 [Cyphomyrmex costatus]|uniref:Uncharacterized protein n=1 Tax=Cyphomyrmex costatus TaxID=456900 RepID=A0A151IA76_9HYME|nr:hypothetical protein ALC62_13273 [Cyphomyrmex costatus]
MVPVAESGAGISTLTPVVCNISAMILSIFCFAAKTPSFSPAIVISSCCTDAGGILMRAPVSAIIAFRFSLCAPYING